MRYVQGCLTVGKEILRQIAGYFIAVGFIFAAFVVRHSDYYTRPLSIVWPCFVIVRIAEL